METNIEIAANTLWADAFKNQEDYLLELKFADAQSPQCNLRTDLKKVVNGAKAGYNFFLNLWNFFLLHFVTILQSIPQKEELSIDLHRFSLSLL